MMPYGLTWTSVNTASVEYGSTKYESTGTKYLVLLNSYIDGLVQHGSNSNALTMEFPQSRTKPSMFCYKCGSSYMFVFVCEAATTNLFDGLVRDCSISIWHQTINCTNNDQVLGPHMASLGYNELKNILETNNNFVCMKMSVTWEQWFISPTGTHSCSELLWLVENDRIPVEQSHHTPLTHWPLGYFNLILGRWISS